MTPATQIGDDSMAILANVTPGTLGKMKEAAAKRMALAARNLQGSGGKNKRPLIDSEIEIDEAGPRNKSQSLTQSANLRRRPDNIVKMVSCFVRDALRAPAYSPSYLLRRASSFQKTRSNFTS